MAWMYILECADGSYYVGSTTDLERRVWEHNEGLGAKYTARRRPVKLVYAAEFATIAEAYEREKQVQGWGRAKREALIRGDYAVLPELARKDFDRVSTGFRQAQPTSSTQRLNPRNFQRYHAKRKGLPDDDQRQRTLVE
jgi:putative endonuclease